MILDQWKNFLERLGSKVTNDEIRYWASYRGQTLSRTGNPEYHSHLLYSDLSPWLPHPIPVFIINYLVRGMIYYKREVTTTRPVMPSYFCKNGKLQPLDQLDLYKFW